MHDAASLSAQPRTALIAPVWHSVLLVVVLLGISLAGVHAHPHIAATHATRIASYAFTLGWEWLLLAFVYWGLRMRGVPLRRLLGVPRPGVHAWGTDIGIALLFWLASAATLAACTLLLRFAHLSPESIRRAIVSIAPASAGELAMWVTLSISAGICEELLFRGYLQQQFTLLTRNLWIGAGLSALVFGFAHGYQGVSGVLLITLYGAFFSALAYRRQSLRAGMLAHAWQDSFSGIALFISSHVLHRMPL